LKNAPLFTKSPFLTMDLVQTEIRSGNVQLDKMYSLYLIECILLVCSWVREAVYLTGLLLGPGGSLSYWSAPGAERQSILLIWSWVREATYLTCLLPGPGSSLSSPWVPAMSAPGFRPPLRSSCSNGTQNTCIVHHCKAYQVHRIGPL